MSKKKLGTRIALVSLTSMMAVIAPLSMSAHADPAQSHTQIEGPMSEHAALKPFTKKKYAIKGNWSLIERDGQTIIRFDDGFKTKKGPDLKLFLSPQTIGDASGKTAVNGALLLGALKSNKGGQEYLVPAGTDLANFKSVLVHCEAYSVLWGGGDL